MAKNKTNSKKIYAFIDSQNLNIGTQKTGWKLDWRKFRKFLTEKYNVKLAYMFIGYMPENENLYEYMHELGYLVVLKQLVDNRGEVENNVISPDTNPTTANEEQSDHKSSIKGNIDADLVLYAMKEIDNYDQAIIVSGDGDFLSLCEYLEEKNKLLAIITPNWMYSTLYKQFEKKIVRLDLLKRRLSYKKRKFRKQ